VSATPEVAPQHADSGESAAWRGLLLLGIVAACAVAAVIGAGRYAWLLLHWTTNGLQWLTAGWQLLAAKIGIGFTLLAVATIAGLATRQLRRSPTGQSQNARAVLILALLPGILIGAIVLGPINSTLTWASEHTSMATAFRTQLMQTLGNDRNAPPQMDSPVPAAPPALASRLLTPAVLGAGWYALQRPATRVQQLESDLTSQGAVRGAMTTLTRAHRSTSGWTISLFAIERITTFGTTDQAGRYTVAFRRQQTQPCDCVAFSAKVVVSHVARLSMSGITVETWREQDGADTSRYATFTHGVEAFTVFVGGGTSTVTPRGDFMTLVRHAVRTGALHRRQ
jgi:hypothetical protein